MKTITTITSVNRFLNSYEFIFCNRKPKLDMRYNRSKEFLLIFNKLKNFNKQERICKLKSRRVNKNFTFENVLSNKIFIDFRKNKHNIKFIHDNFIDFYGRNHHAKNNFDLKVLSILKKNINYQNLINDMLHY